MKKILVTGLCTLHWGRLQYGNIGNYYIIEPLFRLLHKYNPDADIFTTFQMDETFQKRENLMILPMEVYYAWRDDDVGQAILDYEQAKLLDRNDGIKELTPWNELVMGMDMVINISGDMWGDNAEHVGKDRFKVDCYKMRAAQLMNKTCILHAVTPGPFDNAWDIDFVKETFEGFSGVYVREKISLGNLKKWGFNTDRVFYAPCPSFVFEPDRCYEGSVKSIVKSIRKQKGLAIGLTFGGFNMPIGPYDMWPREDSQYDSYVQLALHILNHTKASIILFSHTNGFEREPVFQLKNGRDFEILKQFFEIMMKKTINNEIAQRIYLIDRPMLPANMKAFIGDLDLLITGRVHASVAALSQCVPAVFIEYDQRVIRSDKMTGFSAQLGMEKFVSSPDDTESLIASVDMCIKSLGKIKKNIQEVLPTIQNAAEEAFRTMCFA